MIAIDQNIVLSVIKRYKIEIYNFISLKEQELKTFKTSPSYRLKRKKVALTITKSQNDYLDYLIKNLKKIVLGTADDLENFESKFEKLIPSKDMGLKGKSQKHTIFKNELIKILGYEKQRNEFYPKFFGELNIKACVYCNSQLTINVLKGKVESKALYQIDHFYPKSYYPCFSVSLFNLYPACANCNLSKSNLPIDFRLYSNNPLKYSKSDFNFSIEKSSIIKYRVNFYKESLIIKFNGKNSNQMNEIFAVNEIYNTQKDIAEEILLKSIIYDKAYRKSLKDSFLELYKDKEVSIQRLILGNYTLDTEIHKRPMSKFMMDIAKQLKLI